AAARDGAERDRAVRSDGQLFARKDRERPGGGGEVVAREDAGAIFGEREAGDPGVGARQELGALRSGRRRRLSGPGRAERGSRRRTRQRRRGEPGNDEALERLLRLARQLPHELLRRARPLGVGKEQRAQQGPDLAALALRQAQDRRVHAAQRLEGAPEEETPLAVGALEERAAHGERRPREL